MKVLVEEKVNFIIMKKSTIEGSDEMTNVTRIALPCSIVGRFPIADDRNLI